MRFDDACQLIPVDRILLHELKDSSVVLRSSCLQRDCRQVLGPHHPRRNSLYIRFKRLSKPFLLQRGLLMRTARGKTT